MGYDQSHEHISSDNVLGDMFLSYFVTSASHVALKKKIRRRMNTKSYTGTSLSPPVRYLPALALISFRYPSNARAALMLSLLLSHAAAELFHKNAYAAGIIKAVP